MGRLRLLAAVLAGVGLALLALTGRQTPPSTADGSVLLVGAAVLLVFVVAESSQFHVEVRQQAFSVSVSDVPLVVGLFLLPPWWLLGVRLLSAAVVFAMRRTTPPKIAFNLALFTAEVAVATALFHALSPGDGTSARDWVLTFAVVLVVDVLSVVAVVAAMQALGAAPGRADQIRMVASVSLSGALATTLALMTLVVLTTTTAGIWLVVALTIVLALAHRAYYGLLRRHADLGRLFEFTRHVGSADSPDDVVATLLLQARELLTAESAVLLRPDDTGRVATPSGRATALVAGRGSRQPAVRQWLRDVGLRDALLVPVRGRDELLGMLRVGNRLGQAATFDQNDLHLLQTLVAHAEALRHGGELMAQLRHDAAHDGLTELANRSLFRSALQRHLSHTHDLPEAAPERSAILLLDLDRFKEVNDTLGHQVGDDLLRLVARRISELVPPDALVARLGGDEFAVLLPHSGGGQDGAAVAAGIVQGLTRSFEVQGTLLEVGASIGVAVIPQDGRDASTLMRHADVAMYAAKARGHPVASYDHNDDRSSVDALAMAGDLRRSLRDGDVVMHLQPQVRLSSAEVVCWEALARWQHPLRGPVMPDDFIPLAERTGLIRQLTDVALAQALAQCAGWSGTRPDVGVAVNLSPRQLLDPGLRATVADALALSGVPARLLTLEITENSIMTDPDAAAEALETLRRLGVRLSVDDFGTGHSSLAYLQRLPLDEVKIDKSFTREIVHNSGTRSIVHAIIDLAHTLGLSVVAEGVEDDASRELLAGFGCDVVQGYLIGRPMPPAQVTAWMRDLGMPAPH